MAKETEPKTYRVSAEVDSELRRLAKVHGGVDRALRFQFGWPADSAVFAGSQSVTVESVARRKDVKEPSDSTIKVKEHMIHSGVRPIAGCVECAEMAGKK